MAPIIPSAGLLLPNFFLNALLYLGGVFFAIFRFIFAGSAIVCSHSLMDSGFAEKKSDEIMFRWDENQIERTKDSLNRMIQR